MKDYIFLFMILGIILIGAFNIRFINRIVRSIGLFFQSIIQKIPRKRRHTVDKADAP